MLYARQVPPEEQTSPLLINGFNVLEKIICDGNDRLLTHETEAYKNIKTNIEWCAYDVEEALAEGDDLQYTYIKEAIKKYLPPHNRQDYTKEEIEKLSNLVQNYSAFVNQRNSITAKMLSIMTGLTYEYQTIRGYCQSDWQDIYYPIAYGEDFADKFAREYFNTGSEWIVHDDDGDPNDPEEISGSSWYLLVPDWDVSGIKKELADFFNVDEQEIVLYKFDGWKKTAIYREER